MKRILTALLLSLALINGAWAAQTKQAPPPVTGERKPLTKLPANATDDASITNAIKERFAKLPSLKDSNVTVATKDGVVTLTGSVKNGAAKGVATKTAKSVRGVKNVDNQIKAENATPAPANETETPAKAKKESAPKGKK